MSQLVPLPINPPPGVVVTESQRASAGRWVLPFDKIRFRHGRPQKIGGNTRVTSTAMVGTPRATLCWQDFLQNGYTACGTYRKLYAFDSGFALNDITPFRATGTLGTNPFTTVNLSNLVTVTQAGHSVNVGDTVIFAGASTFNNVNMNGTFVCVNVVSGSVYTVTATTTANASGSGGGAAVTFEYEISAGTELGAYGQGWGTGQWGLGTWGTPRGSSTIFFEPRVWTLDHFGVVLCATYNGGSLWFFDPTQNEPWPRAVSTFLGSSVTGAPNNTCRAVFVTPERFIFALCNGLVVNVCSQGDPTTWIPATTNTAFARTLQIGTKLVGGKPLAPYLSMVWSDNAAYLFQYTGNEFIYNSSVAGVDCGLIAPSAATTVDGFAYWMGPDNFYLYNGSVQPIPNVEDIRKYVFDALPDTLAYQCTAIYVPKYHEIFWFYPTAGSTNPTNYVIYHIDDQCWSVGAADFYSSASVTAGRASGSHFTSGDTSPVMAGTDGYLYAHDPVSGNMDDNGNPMTWQLTLSPFAADEAIQSVDLEGIEFDFFQQIGNVTATVNTYDRLTDPAAMDSQTSVLPEADAGLTDFRVSGRYISLELTSSDPGNYMRLGRPRAFVRPTAKRR